ncbi:hypothetical protein [Vibrio sp. D431a]|uniref:hypothetical protein n=1 Tax=Vibrio sp. D431a TaxID=2837388 RepID=UPI00255684A1|nr:hypothetical protein [Vibrio sp. D431a]MDK9790642.1 hypothetical protein [Vibrio sp. D431a]
MMRLRDFVSFTLLTYLSIASLVSVCASLLLSIEPHFTETAFDHGGFALTFLLIMSARSTMMMKKRKTIINRTLLRRSVALLSISFGAFLAMALLFYVTTLAGYNYVSPDNSATAGIYAFNVSWFFFMFGLVEIGAKLTNPLSKRMQIQS